MVEVEVEVAEVGKRVSVLLICLARSKGFEPLTF